MRASDPAVYNAFPRGLFSKEFLRTRRRSSHLREQCQRQRSIGSCGASDLDVECAGGHNCLSSNGIRWQKWRLQDDDAGRHGAVHLTAALKRVLCGQHPDCPIRSCSFLLATRRAPPGLSPSPVGTSSPTTRLPIVSNGSPGSGALCIGSRSAEPCWLRVTLSPPTAARTLPKATDASQLLTAQQPGEIQFHSLAVNAQQLIIPKHRPAKNSRADLLAPSDISGLGAAPNASYERG